MKDLKRLLEDLSQGRISVDQAFDRLKFLPYEEMDGILLDHHRQIRKGFPEVIYGRGKTAGQIREAILALLRQRSTVLVTKVGERTAAALQEELEMLEYDPVARAMYHVPEKDEASKPESPKTKDVLVVTAGTSDLPVAREACLTLELMNVSHHQLVDVGVAGLHRLFGQLHLMKKARVIICIAGMEGALPSIVAGMVGCPVVAVPTSTGYGSNMGGLVPLMAMLNSCAPGIGVVNIDNGYGAAALAAAIIWSNP